MRIGIFGGTFDPFTVAHLAIVEKVLEQNLVDKVIVMPTIVDWHRAGKAPLLKTYEKERIIDVMTWGSKYKDQIDLDFSELHANSFKENRRYLHMLVDATQRYGLDNEYFTIIGTDSLWNFKTWWKHDVILKMSRLIAVSGRDGIMLPDETYGAAVVSIDPKFANVSASEIRERFTSVDDYLDNVNSKEV